MERKENRKILTSLLLGFLRFYLVTMEIFTRTAGMKAAVWGWRL